ncbi:hypothetical protein N665_0168s0003 [Sinapis alba]|nr:hypothetical protein N665_0168s0003 [Sinapis alba]
MTIDGISGISEALLVGGNSDSGSNGSKRAHESDASDSNSGRMEQIKKLKKRKGTALKVVNKDFNKFKQIKAQEFERFFEKLAILQEEAHQRRNETIQMQKKKNQLMKEKTWSKKMKMWLKLSEKKHLNDQSKEMFQ